MNRIDWIGHHVTGPDVLDVGCGAGRLGVLLGREGLRCVDLDPTASGCALTFPDDSFDTVVLADALQQVTNRIAVLTEARRVLRPHGRILVTVPLGLTDGPGDKQAYNPLALGRLLEPFFRTDVLELVNDTDIACVGLKVPTSANPTTDERLEVLQHLSTLLEQCFVERDRALVTARRQLLAVTVQAAALSNANVELQLAQDARAAEPEQLAEQNRELQARATQAEEARRHAVVGRRMRDLLRATTPANAIVLVISRGDTSLVELEGRQGWHFPQTADGVYAGHHPQSSDEAIAHLEELRRRGAGYFVVPSTARWWLEYYAGFKAHLESTGTLVALDHDVGAVYALHATAGEPDRHLARTIRNGRPLMAAILDEFTTACFRPEATLLAVRPDNWRDALENMAPDLLLVESAWKGNDGAWRLKVHERGGADELAEVVQYCKSRRIPTAFWNKEDPPFFQTFIHRAPLFDCVFTSDSDCIPRYREVVNHDRVFPLPFAAQPAIHNPVVECAREYDVCFAGSYRTNFVERLQDMEMMLRPALDFGLHIYDRYFGQTGPTCERSRFPEVYRPAIKGRLDYAQMVDAYKRYKVFLNVNSVVMSPTMFSRRVFELLACGTVVVSAYSRGIEELLGRDVVFIVDSADETRTQLERLLHDEDAWRRASVRGIRRVLGRHTYAHRLAFIRQQLGLGDGQVASPSVSIVARVRSVRELARIEETLTAQTYRRAHVVLVLGAPDLEHAVPAFRNALDDLDVTVLPPATAADAVERELKGDFVWAPRAADFYGPEFLRDCMLATTYASADIIGKTAHVRLGSNAQAVVCNPGREFRRGDPVTPGARVVLRAAMRTGDLEALLDGRPLRSASLRSLAIDGFNYLCDAYAPDSLTPLCPRHTLDALVV